ncbi:MAG: helix-turn-helix domain-containing protein [Chloroflexota bacterium]
MPDKGSEAVPTPAAEHLINDIQTLRVLFDVTRARIMQTMVKRPRSVQEIAAELDVPFTRLYYHINLLERHNLIRVVSTRTLSGAVEEKFYRVTARMYVINRKLLTPGNLDDDHELIEAQLEVAFDGSRRVIREFVVQGLISANSRPPAPDSLTLLRRTAHIPPDKLTSFHQRLMQLVDEFVSQNTEGEDPFTLTVALHRDNSDTPDDDTSGA